MTEYLYGRRSVTESLRANRRKIKRLVVDERSLNNVAEIVDVAQSNAVEVGTTQRGWLDSKTQNANHQGVVLEASDYPYASLDEILSLAKDQGESPFLLLLDLIQDVQNVGTLLRTAEAVGVHGVIIQERRAADITPAVVNASSGAVEHLLIAQETNLVRTMNWLKEHDVWLAGLDVGDDTIRYDKANWKGGLGIVVGSEGKGLRRLVRETCDFIVSLPMHGKIESLNAATAGSIALYAAWRGRGFGEP